MHNAFNKQNFQESIEPTKSFRFLDIINITAISDRISRSRPFPGIFGCFRRPLSLKAGYQFSKEINLARFSN